MSDVKFRLSGLGLGCPGPGLGCFLKGFQSRLFHSPRTRTTILQILIQFYSIASGSRSYRTFEKWSRSYLARKSSEILAWIHEHAITSCIPVTLTTLSRVQVLVTGVKRVLIETPACDGHSLMPVLKLLLFVFIIRFYPL